MRTLYISHETYSKKFWLDNVDHPFDEAFFSNAKWLSLPNSTVRLSATNLMAIRRIQEERFDIDVRFDEQWLDELADIYKDYELIVVNGIARATSIKFVLDLLDWAKGLSGDVRPRIVLGTEITWDSLLKKGEISQEQYEGVYFDNLLLRHTARTDKALIASGRLSEARVQEFEIGLDSSVFPEPSSHRDKILFVRGPEGRKTKNNEGIDEIVELLEEDSQLTERFEVVQIQPPYSVLDLWRLFSEAAFLVFTSIGETFSYVLNDAKAMGVVTLYPQQMYTTPAGWKYVIDTYPEVGTKYTSNSNALELLREIGLDQERLAEESARSKHVALERFGLERIESNWRRLLSDECLNDKKLYIYDRAGCSMEEASERASAFGAEYAIAYLNRGYQLGDRITDFDYPNRVSHIRYPVTEKGGEYFRWMSIEDGLVVVDDSKQIQNEDLDNSVDFIQLAIRSYKVSELVVESSLRNTEFGDRLGGLVFNHSISGGLQPVKITWV